MTVELKHALDEAQYVEFHDPRFFGVWHGGHTVNFYEIVDMNEAYATDTMSIGDYETGEVTLQEAKNAMKQKFNSFE